MLELIPQRQVLRAVPKLPLRKKVVVQAPLERSS